MPLKGSRSRQRCHACGKPISASDVRRHRSTCYRKTIAALKADLSKERLALFLTAHGSSLANYAAEHEDKIEEIERKLRLLGAAP